MVCVPFRTLVLLITARVPVTTLPTAAFGVRLAVRTPVPPAGMKTAVLTGPPAMSRAGPFGVNEPPTPEVVVPDTEIGAATACVSVVLALVGSPDGVTWTW